MTRRTSTKDETPSSPPEDGWVTNDGREILKLYDRLGARIHFKVAHYPTACVEGGDLTRDDVLFELYTTQHKDLVSCQQCLEWMHA